MTHQVAKNDVESLLGYLRSLGIGEEDVEEIEGALREEPTASGGSFGPKVSAWLGRMISKAASGAMNMGTETAVTAFTQALNGYYGL